MSRIEELKKRKCDGYDKRTKIKSSYPSYDIGRHGTITARIKRLERLYEQNSEPTEDSRLQNLGFDLRKVTPNNIRKERKQENLIDHIKVQAEILKSKLFTTEKVSIDCAITEFLISVVNKSNQITSFQFE